MTRLSASGNLLAIGYSSGTIIVIDLDTSTMIQDEENESRMVFNTVHKFSFHRSGVSTILFDQQNTQLFSGGLDTSIIIYDLVSDSASFKLLGHKEEIVKLSVFKMHTDKQDQTVLVSCSKDGFVKLWDLVQQYCLFTFSDPSLSRIADFVLVPSLRLVVLANCSQQEANQHLHVYEIVRTSLGQLEFKAHSLLKKESTAKPMELSY